MIYFWNNFCNKQFPFHCFFKENKIYIKKKHKQKVISGEHVYFERYLGGMHIIKFQIIWIWDAGIAFYEEVFYIINFALRIELLDWFIVRFFHNKAVNLRLLRILFSVAMYFDYVLKTHIVKIVWLIGG